MDIVDEAVVWGLLGIAMVLVLVWVVPAFIRLLTQGEMDSASGQRKSVFDWGDQKPSTAKHEKENENEP
jgi:Zn-dependent protease